LITPLITIGIASFNAEDTIARAIGSALGQNWQPIEIIVVDDASTDNTRSVIGEIAQRHDNIRLIVNARNAGAAVARNEIIAQAKGDFIVFFDDDDVSRPERVARQFCRITAYERDFARGAPVVCHTAREQVYPNGSRRVERTMGTFEGRAAPSGLPVAYRILMGTPIRDCYGSTATCSQMARTDVYRMLGGFHPAFRRGQDTDFCVRLARAGGHFAGIAEPLVIQTMTRRADKTLDRLKVQDFALLEKHRDLIEDEELYRFCREWTDLKFRWLGGERAAFFELLMQLGIRHPLLTLRRLRFALPGIGTNRAFRALHHGRHAG
jgi:glycosyltransferase involved in cell wall biosynthesis